jgi:hypothetical protein
VGSRPVFSLAIGPLRHSAWAPGLCPTSELPLDIADFVRPIRERIQRSRLRQSAQLWQVLSSAGARLSFSKGTLVPMPGSSRAPY